MFFSRSNFCKKILFRSSLTDGTYYVSCLEHIDSTHPGAKEEIEKAGLSVRRNTFGIGQSIDMAGEQSYMRNAKTAGKSTFINYKFFFLLYITSKMTS